MISVMEANSVLCQVQNKCPYKIQINFYDPVVNIALASFRVDLNVRYPTRVLLSFTRAHYKFYLAEGDAPLSSLQTIDCLTYALNTEFFLEGSPGVVRFVVPRHHAQFTSSHFKSPSTSLGRGF